jgi:hypothetical protein
MGEFISIRGARENNLKDVTLRIPKRKHPAEVPAARRAAKWYLRARQRSW